MQAVSEVPHDAVAQLEALVTEKRVQDCVQWDDLAVIDIVADLPANRPMRMQHPDAFLDDARLFLQVGSERQLVLVTFADVVRG